MRLLLAELLLAMLTVRRLVMRCQLVVVRRRLWVRLKQLSVRNPRLILHFLLLVHYELLVYLMLQLLLSLCFCQ